MSVLIEWNIRDAQIDQTLFTDFGETGSYFIEFLDGQMALKEPLTAANCSCL